MLQNYKEAEEVISFERCIDVLSKLVLKYGRAVLKSNTPDESLDSQQTAP